MEFLTILKIASAVATIAIGLLSALRPLAVTGFTGLAAPGARGKTEIRAILGGVFIGAGLAPLLLNAPAAYQGLGILYLVTAAVRAIGIAVDRSSERSNIISLASEIALGVLLIL
jgi:hypothetical protein